MATKNKACKICKTIFKEGDRCPNCGAKEYTDSYKGRVVIVNAEKSEIAEKLNIDKAGNYAIKTR